MFSTITKVINEAKKGKIFILVDDENRENEGDLVIPANKVKHKDITFMAKYGRGLICLALDSKQVKKLNNALADFEKAANAELKSLDPKATPFKVDKYKI